MALSQWLPVSRKGGGEFNTSNITIPAGVDTVYVQLDVAPADFATPDRSVTASVEISTNGAQSWEPFMQVGWVGGPPPGKAGVWYAQTGGLSALSGALVRAHFSTSGTFRWGLKGELL